MNLSARIGMLYFIWSTYYFIGWLFLQCVSISFIFFRLVLCYLFHNNVTWIWEGYLALSTNQFTSLTLHKNWNLLLRIFSVNVTKSAISCSHFMNKSLTLDYHRSLVTERSLGQSCDTTIASFVLNFFPLSWWSVNLLICVKKISNYFIIIVSGDL